MAKAKIITKKVHRKQALFLKQEPDSDVKFQEEPSCHVFVANGGLQNGLGRELISHLLRQSLLLDDHLKELYLPAGKDFAFATFECPQAASAAVAHLNGVCLQEKCRNSSDNLLELLSPAVLSGPPLHLYLCFVDKVPPMYSLPTAYAESCSSDLPPGLVLLEEFITVDEERELLQFFSAPKTRGSGGCGVEPLVAGGIGQRKGSVLSEECALPASGNVLRHRTVSHYGYEFLYGSSNVDPDCPLPGGLPALLEPLLKKMVEEKVVEERPDQLTVNHYLPGAGIPPHVDTHSAFKGSILSLSLGCHVVMDFRHAGDGRKISVFLQRRSLLVMAGEARYSWTHGIAARHFDEVHSLMPGYRESRCEPACQTGQSGQPGPSAQTSLSCSSTKSAAITATVVPRGTRTSLTFRKVRKKPCVCNCDYPSLCDSRQQ